MRLIVLMHSDYVNRSKIVMSKPVFGSDLRSACHVPLPLQVDP
jgi:hypothetical protein